jgi:hypothetical protein
VKTCSKCNESKFEIDFQRRGNRFSSQCKKCLNEYQNNRYVKKRVEKLNNLSQQDAYYIAGFFDGEGCINLAKQHAHGKTATYYLSISIANTFPGIIDWIALRVGYGKVYNPKRPSTIFKERKPIWEWRLSGRHAADFLKQIHPYMKVKTLQSEVAMEYAKTLMDGCTRNRLPDNVVMLRNSFGEKLTKMNQG